MKTLLTFCFSYLLFTSFAATKTTVADGDWFNPANWSPSGVPLIEDTVLINHNITTNGVSVDFGANWLIVNSNASLESSTIFGLHGNLRSYGVIDIQTFAIGDGDSTLMYGTMLGDKLAPGNPVNINYGTIESDSLIAGEPFDNFGLIDNSHLVSATELTNHSQAAIVVAGTALFNSLALNESDATIEVGDLLLNGLTTNNGSIFCNNFTLGSGASDGIGKYCIALCLFNAGTITGTLDICDATPGMPCDMQLGTIAGTVTFCSSSPCASNVMVEELEIKLNLFPNPVDDLLNIEVNESTIGTEYQILSAMGQLIYSGEFQSKQNLHNLSQITSGVYFVKTQANNTHHKFTKN